MVYRHNNRTGVVWKGETGKDMDELSVSVFIVLRRIYSMSERKCPNCGRKMKQQFIGLKHCKCGTSWLKGTGYFEREPDMVFCLQRVRKGKKVKQIPWIRYEERNKTS